MGSEQSGKAEIIKPILQMKKLSLEPKKHPDREGHGPMQTHAFCVQSFLFVCFCSCYIQKPL